MIQVIVAGLLVAFPIGIAFYFQQQRDLNTIETIGNWIAALLVYIGFGSGWGAFKAGHGPTVAGAAMLLLIAGIIWGAWISQVD